MATQPFTGPSYILSQTQTETEPPRKETESKPPQKETKSELQQNRTSEAKTSNNQTFTIRGIQIKAVKCTNAGISDCNNKYGEGGADGQNKTDYNIDGVNVDAKEVENAGIQNVGNEYNSRKDEAAPAKKKGTSKKP